MDEWHCACLSVGAANKKCYGDAMRRKIRNSLAGISDRDQGIMARLLRMPPEQQKAAPKPTTAQGDAQRRRREKERHQPTEASGAG
jgi:hypothetical protein